METNLLDAHCNILGNKERVKEEFLGKSADDISSRVTFLWNQEKGE